MKKITDLMLELNEIDFKSHDQYKKYKSKHKMRKTTKISIGGKDTTAGDADKVVGKKDKIQRGAPKTDPKPLDKLAKMGVKDKPSSASKSAIDYTAMGSSSSLSKDELDTVLKVVNDKDNNHKILKHLEDHLGENESISELVQDWLGWSEEEAEDSDHTNYEDVADKMMKDAEYMADHFENYSDDEGETVGSGIDVVLGQTNRPTSNDGEGDDDDYASGMGDDSDVPSDKFQDTLDYDDEDDNYGDDDDRDPEDILANAEEAVRDGLMSQEEFADLQDEYGDELPDDSSFKPEAKPDEKAERQAKVDKDAIVNHLLDKAPSISSEKFNSVAKELEDEWKGSKDNYDSVDDYIADLEKHGGLEGYMDESVKGNLGTIIKEEILNVLKERYTLDEDVKKIKGPKGYDYPSHDLNEFEGRPIPMDTPNEFAYLDFKKWVYKNRSLVKKEMLKHVRKSDGQSDSSRMFMTLCALWYKWAHKYNKAFTHIMVQHKLKFGRALMGMMVQDNLIFDKNAWKKDNNMTHVKGFKRRPIEGKITEASGSWLTKKIFDDLNKELKRTEPNMYRNRYFKKAFSMYLHDLDSMEYSKLGRDRFKHLDKAWDYIDKNTEALSSTNDKLNKAHIRSQFDGPIYAMLKHNKYKLK